MGKFITMTMINKAKAVSLDEVCKRGCLNKNYLVAVGSKYAMDWIEVHVGGSSDNHLETIKKLCMTKDHEGEEIVIIKEMNCKKIVTSTNPYRKGLKMVK